MLLWSSTEERMRFKKMIIPCLLITAAVLLFGGCCVYYNKTNRWTTVNEPGEKPIINPMKGFVAWGENYRQDPWVSFAYVPVYWSLIEPQEGVYDFEELEQRCFFEKWRSDGVRLIFRVVADSPSDEMHMDIPKWLYETMEEEGDWYDCEYGKGFSPDYRNRIFQNAHRKLICALAERYGEDPQTAFFELGSLGHWGEWHVNSDAGIQQFPFQSVTDRYVQDYLDVFPSSKLLLRRPYAIGAENRLGLYNDSFGQEESHNLWLDWIQGGYVSDQNGEQLEGMKDFWKYAPSGGEFATSQEDSWYFKEEQFDVTKSLLEKSHTTFLGPNAPKYKELKGEERSNAEQLLQEMGYCFGIRKCEISRNFFDRTLRVNLQFENSGIAPLYENWKILISLRDEQGETVWECAYESELSKWIPGTYTFETAIGDGVDLEKGKYTLWVGIEDPLTGKPGVAMRMDTKEENMMYQAGIFEV